MVGGQRLPSLVSYTPLEELVNSDLGLPVSNSGENQEVESPVKTCCVEHCAIGIENVTINSSLNNNSS